MDMGRKRTISDGLPPNLTIEGDRYRYRNPETGERPWLGTDKAKAIEIAEKANLVLQVRRQAKGTPVLMGYGIDMYIENVVPHKPWDTDTRKNAIYRLRALQADMRKRPVVTTDRVFLAEWLDRKATSGDTFNKWRALLVELWRYWIERKWVDYNEAEAVMKRSTSKKLAENRKTRRRLDIDQFWAIHDHDACEHWLKIAMEQSLVTLQARKEICGMQLGDYRDGWLYVIRDKVAAESEMAFIRIGVTPQIEDIRRRSMDGIASPFLVHRRSKSLKTTERQQKAHWSAVRPEYLSKAFKAARDATALFEGMAPRARPSFHEIRSLGARLYRAAGYEERYLQALMTHANKRTTEIYLSGGHLTDDHFHRVKADLTLDSTR